MENAAASSGGQTHESLARKCETMTTPAMANGARVRCVPRMWLVEARIRGMRHSGGARRLLRELDAELASASEHAGRSLVWTAQDRAVLELIADQTDRRTEPVGGICG